MPTPESTLWGPMLWAQAKINDGKRKYITQLENKHDGAEQDLQREDTHTRTLVANNICWGHNRSTHHFFFFMRRGAPLVSKAPVVAPPRRVVRTQD